MNDVVSIIMPVYNGAKTMEVSINSILKQTRVDNIELIIINHGSVDESQKIIDNLIEGKNKLNFYDIRAYKCTRGQFKHSFGSPVNLGVEKSVGSFIFVMACDDFIVNDFIEKNLQIIKQTNMFAIQSFMRRVIVNNITNQYYGHAYRNIDELKYLLSTHGSVISCPTFFARREVYEKNKMKDEYENCVDYEFYCNVVDSGYYIYPTQMWLGYLYREHDGQCTQQLDNNNPNYEQKIQKIFKEKWYK